MTEPITYFNNRSDNNYQLDYTYLGKRHEIFLFSGDSRILKLGVGDFDFKISTLNNRLKNFKFYSSLPGLFNIENSSFPDINYIIDPNTKREILTP